MSSSKKLGCLGTILWFPVLYAVITLPFMMAGEYVGGEFGVGVFGLVGTIWWVKLFAERIDKESD